MARSEVPEQSTAVVRQMWKTVMSGKAASPTEVNAQEHIMSELESLAQRRLTRILESQTPLPKVLWCVLLVGGVLTIVSACTFATANVKLQTLQVFSLSLLVSLSLVAIADIHRPFHGVIHVSENAFQRARQSIPAR